MSLCPDEKAGHALRAGKRINERQFTGARRSCASDRDIRVLVGRRPKETDFLTFRGAKSQEYGCTAADIPLARRRSQSERREIPRPKPSIEAAQLAALCFQPAPGSSRKSTVHIHTPKKHVTNRKARARCWSVSSFKTILSRR
jgi:predicted ribosome quality control (RQC) complex YloA/Tae2 family protein